MHVAFIRSGYLVREQRSALQYKFMAFSALILYSGLVSNSLQGYFVNSLKLAETIYTSISP